MIEGVIKGQETYRVEMFCDIPILERPFEYDHLRAVFRETDAHFLASIDV